MDSLNRRDFLKTTALAGTALAAPAFVRTAAARTTTITIARCSATTSRRR